MLEEEKEGDRKLEKSVILDCDRSQVHEKHTRLMIMGNLRWRCLKYLE